MQRLEYIREVQPSDDLFEIDLEEEVYNDRTKYKHETQAKLTTNQRNPSQNYPFTSQPTSQNYQNSFHPQSSQLQNYLDTSQFQNYQSQPQPQNYSYNSQEGMPTNSSQFRSASNKKKSPKQKSCQLVETQPISISERVSFSGKSHIFTYIV